MSCGILAGELDLKLKDDVAHISRTRMIAVKKNFAPSGRGSLLVFEYLKRSPALRVISINKSRVKLFLRVMHTHAHIPPLRHPIIFQFSTAPIKNINRRRSCSPLFIQYSPRA